MVSLSIAVEVEFPLYSALFLRANHTLPEKSNKNATIEPKKNLTIYLIGSLSSSSAAVAVVVVEAVVAVLDIVIAEGKASTTASARSLMNEGVQLRAGTLPQFEIPESRARSLYSMSISSRVSICSLTKLKLQKH